MQKILIVEDEEDVAKGLEINLKKEGYRVFKASRGDTAVDLAIKENPHLILLDVMLPGMSGIEVCRELREKGIEAPIIMLTAKGDEIDRVLGLEIGADDYVTKPFSLRELMARIGVRLRRHPPGLAKGVSKYRFGDVEIDFETCQATRKGTAVVLTHKELDILRLFIRRRGEVVTRDRMLDEVWGYDSSSTTRTVDTHIAKLRQKLEPDPATPRYILSVYGEGYKFVG